MQAIPTTQAQSRIPRAFPAAAAASSYVPLTARSRLTSSVSDDSSCEEAPQLDFLREKQPAVTGEKSRWERLKDYRRTRSSN